MIVAKDASEDKSRNERSSRRDPDIAESRASQFSEKPIPDAIHFFCAVAMVKMNVPS
jgi:hypothetical protein